MKAGSPNTALPLRGSKQILRKSQHRVREALVPQHPGECFGHGAATFMIMGDKCAPPLPLCDVDHGRPIALDGMNN